MNTTTKITIFIIIISSLIVMGIVTYLEKNAEWTYNNDVQINPNIEPIQTEITETIPVIEISGKDFIAELTPRYNYSISAKVILRKNYYYDYPFSNISPMDLGLGWDVMTDDSILNRLDIRNSNRFLVWHSWADDLPYQEMANCTSNVHIIPATENLSKALKKIYNRDTIYLEGYLVDVYMMDGTDIFEMETSVIRSDSGWGACEILYVKKLILDDKCYQ